MSSADAFRRKLNDLETGLRRDRGLIKKELVAKGYTPKFMRLCSDWADNFYNNIAVLKEMRRQGSISIWDCEYAKSRLREAAFGKDDTPSEPTLPEPKTPAEAATALETSKAEAEPPRFRIQPLNNEVSK